jgi:ubiquitin-conjugating enzyme E2 J2
VCPEDYPARPPYIMLTMNNGAFIINHKICLSITDYHPESWNPAWTVTHIIVGCISFWLTGEYTYGSLDSYDRDDMSYHKHNASYRSSKTVLEDPKFEEVLGYYKPFIGINEVKEVKNWIPLIEEDEKLAAEEAAKKVKEAEEKAEAEAKAKAEEEAKQAEAKAKAEEEAKEAEMGKNQLQNVLFNFVEEALPELEKFEPVCLNMKKA